jgi:hypothetical protein
MVYLWRYFGINSILLETPDIGKNIRHNHVAMDETSATDNLFLLG